MYWEWDSEEVPVARSILRQILEDRSCPLNVRLELQRTLRCHDVKAGRHCATQVESLVQSGASTFACLEGLLCLGRLVGPALALIAAQLPLAEILALRATSVLGIRWAMHQATEGHRELKRVHDRIRARLWIQRAGDITKDTADETIFETQVRSFANDALRHRMETEMVEAKTQMERQIHAFQTEVDRRMEEQALRVHAIIEQRVQQQLDTIMAAEMDRVRAMVEARVQDGVRKVVQNEVRTTVSEVQLRLAALARENDQLRKAFVEHSDLCFRSLVWALSPHSTGTFARMFRMVWCCRRRCAKFSAWLFGKPTDCRRERFQARLEALRSISSVEHAQSLSDLNNALGPDFEDDNRILPMLAMMTSSSAQLVAPRRVTASGSSDEITASTPSAVPTALTRSTTRSSSPSRREDSRLSEIVWAESPVEQEEDAESARSPCLAEPPSPLADDAEQQEDEEELGDDCESNDLAVGGTFTGFDDVGGTALCGPSASSDALLFAEASVPSAASRLTINGGTESEESPGFHEHTAHEAQPLLPTALEANAAEPAPLPLLLGPLSTDAPRGT